MVQTGPDGVDRYAERLRDLLALEPLHLVENEHLPLGVRERGEGALEGRSGMNTGKALAKMVSFLLNKLYFRGSGGTPACCPSPHTHLPSWSRSRPSIAAARSHDRCIERDAAL